METNASMTKKWSLRGLLRRFFRRQPSTSELVVQPTTPPVEDPPSPHSNLTKAEKTMISDTLRGDGTWYKCRQNHPYLVGACGIPRQFAACPTCGETIGGLDQKSAKASGNRSVKTPFAR